MTSLKRLILTGLCAFAMACGGAQTRSDEGPTQDPPTDAASGQLPSGPPVLVEEVGRSSSVDAGQAGESAPEVAQGDVKAFMTRGPSFALTQIVVDPVHGKSGFVGYKLVSATSDAQAFLRPQVKLGDVITHLNGVRIERPDDYLRAWNALKDTGVIRIDFLRDETASVATWAVR